MDGRKKFRSQWKILSVSLSKKREYSLQMADEQVVFEQTLVALESEVMSFSTYQDVRIRKRRIT